LQLKQILQVRLDQILYKDLYLFDKASLRFAKHTQGKSSMLLIFSAINLDYDIVKVNLVSLTQSQAFMDEVDKELSVSEKIAWVNALSNLDPRTLKEVRSFTKDFESNHPITHTVPFAAIQIISAVKSNNYKKK